MHERSQRGLSDNRSQRRGTLGSAQQMPKQRSPPSRSLSSRVASQYCSTASYHTKNVSRSRVSIFHARLSWSTTSNELSPSSAPSVKAQGSWREMTPARSGVVRAASPSSVDHHSRHWSASTLVSRISAQTSTPSTRIRPERSGSRSPRMIAVLSPTHCSVLRTNDLRPMATATNSSNPMVPSPSRSPLSISSTRLVTKYPPTAPLSAPSISRTALPPGSIAPDNVSDTLAAMSMTVFMSDRTVRSSASRLNAPPTAWENAEKSASSFSRIDPTDKSTSPATMYSIRTLDADLDAKSLARYLAAIGLPMNVVDSVARAAATTSVRFTVATGSGLPQYVGQQHLQQPQKSDFGKHHRQVSSSPSGSA
eukprot:m.118469 g.118469  ORF g.118469 m.118469 type:complete len:366 (+) comp21730_c0_seq1:143-1240(+)